MDLIEGVYENIINKDIINKNKEGLVIEKAALDSAESPRLFAEYISEAIRHRLEDETLSNQERMEFANNILSEIGVDPGQMIEEPDKILSAVFTQKKIAERSLTKTSIKRPSSGFRSSSLFTGGQSALPLSVEIDKDISSADRIYMIVSFLRLSGLRLIINQLKEFCSQPGHSLKVITTTYCGFTDAKAVEQLSNLPNTEIRISYNTEIERLHAKAYIFERNSGLSTAYIGSSNLSKSAHTDGLEWNVRVTNIENPHIIKASIATFEQYWNSPNFEDFSIGGIDKFIEEVGKAKAPELSPDVLQVYSILPHQKAILDKLDVLRSQGINRNLIVAATGTGKTVISAFDYNRFRMQNQGHGRLLYIAHREEILKQARKTFCSVLQDQNFGELWVGNYAPQGNLDALFVSNITANNNFDKLKELGQDYYDFIIIDEAHHSSASTYRQVIDFFKPHLFVGLTATPERMDGTSLLPDFCGRISAEIRLPKALSEGLLTPFHYFCVTDSADLSSSELWVNGKYDTDKLSLKLSTLERCSLIVSRLKLYLADENACKALCFCASQQHADYMCEMFNTKYNLKSAVLTSKNSEERKELREKLARGDINYLFVVDIFNEGVDIPEVDTVLFLRPTESLTIFLQQLGRGLRLYPGKQVLTVLDFVAQANKNYDFASRFRALLTKTGVNVEKQVADGFTLVPTGCHVMMEEKAQRYILDNIHSAIYNVNRLRRELSHFTYIPSLSEFIESNGQDIRLLYKGNKRCWTVLKKECEKCDYASDDMTDIYESSMANFIHLNSARYLAFIRRLLKNNCQFNELDSLERTYATMFYYELYGKILDKTPFKSINSALETFLQYPLFVKELEEILDYQLSQLSCNTFSVGNGIPDGVEMYAQYTREEIFTLFGMQTLGKQMQGAVAGVYDVPGLNTEIFFVTLNKSDKDFSPSTMFNDYVAGEYLFHWQSQNTDSHSGKGARFVKQKENGKKFVLFVRQDKKDGYGNTCPFLCFGLVDYISSEGDFPMNINWRLQQPALPEFIKAV